MTEHAEELERGERFRFGANWMRFLSVVDEARVADAVASLRDMLGTESLGGLTFLDAGSGSGLFSLAARRLGARVHSFDYDPQSVACTAEMRRRFAPGDAAWTVEGGSVLDAAYLERLGTFDVVYSWGVLHHTGAMWRAVDNVMGRVNSGGMLFIALYNDQGFISRYWLHVKRLYVRVPLLRAPLIGVHLVYPFLPALVYRAVTGRLHQRRGMSFWRDVVDWVGGLPFEVASVDAVQAFCVERGFTSRRVVTTRRHGCNEFILMRNGAR
jgi:2-polyprenyl-6-hydroxyphenyl methylase/3-demethylubiquinone-9 3-methyltransferase